MRVDEYRARAERCEALAKQLRNFEAKKVYENLANHWTELAEQAESRERASETT